MTQEVHHKDVSFAGSTTSEPFRVGTALNIVAIRIPVSGTWGANVTIAIQSADGTALLGSQTPLADINDWSDCYDGAGGQVLIQANAGASDPRKLHNDVFLAGEFFRLVASGSKTATVRVYYKSIN